MPFLYSEKVRAPAIHAGPIWGPRLQTAIFVSGSAVLALLVGVEVAEGGPDRLTTPVLGLVALAGAIVMFSIPPEKLFLGWVLLAPLLQNSADESVVGRPLSFALYLAPPVVLACQTLGRWRRRADTSVVDLLPAAYVGFVLVSVVVTTSLLQDDLVGSAKALFQTTAIGAIIFYFLVYGPGSTIAATAIVRLLLIGAVLQSTLSLVEFASGWGLWGTSPWQLSDPPRSVATLVNPAALGTFIGCGIVIALAVFAWDGPFALRRLSWATLLLGVPGLLVTLTRAPVLATAVAALGVILLSNRSRIAALAAVAVIALAVVALWPQLTSTELYESRIANRVNVDGRSDVEDVSLRAAARKPVAGWGYGAFDEAKIAAAEGFDPRVEGSLDTTSHNGFLTILVELGAIGLALYLIPWLVILARGVGLVRRRLEERWFTVACIGATAVIALAIVANDFRVFSFLGALPWLFLGCIRRDLGIGGRTSTS